MQDTVGEKGRDVLLWTLSHGRASVDRSARTHLQQVYADTTGSLEDWPGAMDYWVRWREREREREGEKERGSQGNPCWQRDLMMMMTILQQGWLWY